MVLSGKQTHAATLKGQPAVMRCDAAQPHSLAACSSAPAHEGRPGRIPITWKHEHTSVRSHTGAAESTTDTDVQRYLFEKALEAEVKSTSGAPERVVGWTKVQDESTALDGAVGLHKKCI